MILWLVFAGITAAVIAVLVAPLRRRAVGGHDAADSVAFYKAQLREVENDVARGLLDDASAKGLTTEISRRLLKAAADEENRRKQPKRPDINTSRVALGVVIGVTALTLGIYLRTGSPSLPSESLASRIEAPLTRNSPVEAMVAKVEARLRANPADGTGWNVIAPVYMRLERYGDAASAFAKAMSLTGETPERLSGYAEALTFANNGAVPEPARQAFEKALQQRPDLVSARYWLAVAKEDAGDPAAARDAYQDLLKGELNADSRSVIEQRLANIETQLTGKPAKPQVTAEQQAMIEQMVTGLAERLEKDGGSLDEWLRLARSYGVLGKTDDAAAAIGKARTQFAGNADAIKQIDALVASLGLKS
jgi:cytochrome c-type biogenesis protein CcmH